MSCVLDKVLDDEINDLPHSERLFLHCDVVFSLDVLIYHTMTLTLSTFVLHARLI